MAIPIPQTWKDAWDKWDLRGFIILSLAFQTFLIFFAPLRKRTSRNWITMPIWSAYLLADWSANFCVGIISSTESDSTGKTSKNRSDLLAFWAPFLLVHLGGPDTITAFALEDNELWLRHLLGLLFQSLAALYLFFQSLPDTPLWLPTMLMFISGIIKYAERTRSLYLASLDRFRDSMLTEPDPGPNYAKLMDEYYSKKEAKLPTRIQMIGEPPDRGSKAVNKVKRGSLTDMEVVLYAHRFFQSFKGLIVDLIFSFRERNQSRNFFLARTAKDAFKVVEVELNFIYEVFYTKVSVLYTIPGYIFRFVSFSCVVVSLVIFHAKSKKTYDPFDVGITYTLLYAAIALDIISFLMLIQSDWSLVITKKLPQVDLLDSSQALQQQAGVSIGGVASETESFNLQLSSCFGWFSHFISRRWSESVSTYNLIYYCLHPRMDVKERLIEYIGMTNFLDELKYVKEKPFTEELRDHIFQELWKKSEIADDLDTAKEISGARGDWVLRMEGWVELLPYITDVDYDESLLLFHIATELCYNDEIPSWQSKPLPNKYRDFSKLLADYMIYLLVMQPTMMSEVRGIGEIRFRDTCAEAKKFFDRGNLRKGKKKADIFKVISYVILSFFKYMGICLYWFFLSLVCILCSPLLIPLALCGGKLLLVQRVKAKGLGFHDEVIMGKLFGKGKEADKQKKACQDILGVNTEVKPVTVKGDRSKSVLFDGCILAKKLREMEKSERKCKWEILSKVWVELLSYAAVHCTANTHVEQLSKGGELITIVWLLMAHFGLGDQFQIGEGHARAKLIVGK